MCSNHSRALLLVSALVLCGCAAQRAPKAPISYRQRTDPPPAAVEGRRAPAPAAKPQHKPARRPARARHESARPEAARQAGAQSVVYRREDSRPQAKVVPRKQPSGAGPGKFADEGRKPRQDPAPVVSPGSPQAVRQEPQRKANPVEPQRKANPVEPQRKSPPVEPPRKGSSAGNAKLKALYDSGFLTREEFLRAGGGK